MEINVSFDTALRCAKGLRAEDDENPEYTRGQAELLADMFGFVGGYEFLSDRAEFITKLIKE